MQVTRRTKIFFCKTFLPRLLKRSDIQNPRLCTGISAAWYDQCTDDWRKRDRKKDDGRIPLYEAVFAGQRRWRSGRAPPKNALTIASENTVRPHKTDVYENATIIRPHNAAIRLMRLSYSSW